MADASSVPTIRRDGDDDPLSTSVTTTLIETGAASDNTTSRRPEDADVDTNDDDDDDVTVVLFYKYGPLSSDRSLMEPYREAWEALCRALSLTGRVLIGLSDRAEGVNGTLAGPTANVEACAAALCGGTSETFRDATAAFGRATAALAASAGTPALWLDADQIKRSTRGSSSRRNNHDGPPFPDLRVRLVSEIVSTGGELSSVDVGDTGVGYLDPREWHERLSRATRRAGDDDENNDRPIIVDCRNRKEVAIGRFEGAVDPGTRTFSQFPKWVRDNEATLRGRDVLMYCTGGIRCEKASAYVRRAVPSAKSVSHLKGGIHKYLDMYGGDGLFRGKNFVFDRRGTDDNGDGGGTSNATGSARRSAGVVGSCLYCDQPWDVFTPDGVCTVCREPTLVCSTCRDGKDLVRGEYHCVDHKHLRTCYFSDLSVFSADELRAQQTELERLAEDIAVGKKFKQKRRTLRRQLDRLRDALSSDTNNKPTDDNDDGDDVASRKRCRSCGDVGCAGDCWGFHGLARKKRLEEEQEEKERTTDTPKEPATRETTRAPRPSASKRASAVARRRRDAAEIRRLGLRRPPSEHRDDVDPTLRCPPPVARALRSTVKGRWCGRTVGEVLRSEFGALRDEDEARRVLESGAVRVNGKTVDGDAVLRNGDVLDRSTHWHEPPVRLTETSIRVTRHDLPPAVLATLPPKNDDDDDDDDDLVVYACDKPSTVPTHPAGPYLANTLTLMVEAQERLPTPTTRSSSLIPCHRLDRATSGLTLCCASPRVARLLQTRMTVPGAVAKLYLAAVRGKFPTSEAELRDARRAAPPCASIGWRDDHVRVDAPVETIDPANGARAVAEGGKPSVSLFRAVAYDAEADESLVACRPVTGRSHQLRVHLRCVGCSVRDDPAYGGVVAANDDADRCAVVVGSVTRAAARAEKTRANDTPNDDDDVGEEDARRARETCRCCREGAKGVEASFSPAQLLRGGHAISLHAYRYAITFETRPRRTKRKRSLEKDVGDGVANDRPKNINDDDDDESHRHVLEFSTERPPWVASFRCDDVEIPWIN